VQDYALVRCAEGSAYAHVEHYGSSNARRQFFRGIVASATILAKLSFTLICWYRVASRGLRRLSR